MSRLPKQAIQPGFREAQEASLAGRHDEARDLFEFAAEKDPEHPHWHLQSALALARTGDLPAALTRLDAAPADVRATPPWRLFAGWLRLRAGDAAGRELVDGVTAEQPENRIAATAAAYGRAREDDLAGALALLGTYPGDNLEVLAWCWAELERAALARPRPPEPPLPKLTAGRGASMFAARRWFRAGVAGTHRHENVLARRWALGQLRRPEAGALSRPLRCLLEIVDRWWPSDPLTAFRQAEAAGLKTPDLLEYLGAELYAGGWFSRAVEPLTRCCEGLDLRADGELPEEICRPLLLRAAALAELRRWLEVAEVLSRLADGELDADAGRTHDFAEPVWLALRGRLRIARGDLPAGARDLELALQGEPALIDERLGQLRMWWGSCESPPNDSR